jgi:hypothetical protein
VIDSGPEPTPAARVETESASRSRFLKPLGTFVLLGLGATLAPGTAKAAGGHCCKDTSCGPCINSIPYKCYDFCLQQYCCWCTANHASQCFDTGCPC